MTSPLTIRIDNQGGACPYQAEGVLVVKGVEYPFYFRYRQEHVQMYVWEPGSACKYFGPEDVLAHYELDDFASGAGYGYMEDAEAVGFIHRWAEEFVNEHTWYCSECHEAVEVLGVSCKDYVICPDCGDVVCRDHLHDHSRLVDKTSRDDALESNQN